MTTVAPARRAPAETTEITWQPKRDLSFEEWASAGEMLGFVNRCSPWWIGDWAKYGQRYGERYERAREITGLSYSTIAQYVWVASKVEFSRRLESLSWSHHAEVAALPWKEQNRWLALAVDRRWSADRLRKEIAHARGRISPPEPGPPSELPAPEALEGEILSGCRCPRCGYELGVEEMSNRPADGGS